MKRDLTKRVNRIITRGEVSGHSHIIIGECEIEDIDNKTIIHTKKDCVIKHLIESVFVEQGVEQHTKEHGDIPLKDNSSYEYIQQREYDPFADQIKKVVD
jgi:hypothetical protein